MKAVVAGDTGPVLKTVADPAAPSGGCVIRVACALIDDVERAHAAPRATPVVVGRAIVGIVDSIAANTVERARDMRITVGRRVVVHPIIRCGACDRCTSGLGIHCANRQTLGVDRDGGLAERVALPLSVLTPIPDALDDERASFAIGISEAIECTRHVRVEGKAYVTILGDGLSALLAALVLGRLNAAVRIVSTDGAIAGITEKLGIRHRLAKEVGRRGDQHVVVDCCGTDSSMALACELIRPRGTILLRTSQERTLLRTVVDRELRVQGVASGSLHEGIDLLARRQVEVAPLIDRRVTLDDAPAALKQPSRLAVLVRGE